MNRLRVNSQEIPRAWTKREEFESTTSSMRGKRLANKHYLYYGDARLNDAEESRLVADLAIGIVYVVFSYDTPIAWVRSDGTEYRVSQKFSQTTSKHQGRLYTLN